MSKNNDDLMWVYHKTAKPKIIKRSEFDPESEEWKESPAEFLVINECGIKSDDPNYQAKCTGLKNSVYNIVDASNKALNLDLMSKDELIGYIKQHTSAEYKESFSKAKLISIISEFIDGDSNTDN
jgi:hypothetical protein